VAFLLSRKVIGFESVGEVQRSLSSEFATLGRYMAALLFSRIVQCVHGILTMFAVDFIN
jgi:hypothetical protein